MSSYREEKINIKTLFIEKCDTIFKFIQGILVKTKSNILYVTRVMDGNDNKIPLYSIQASFKTPENYLFSIITVNYFYTSKMDIQLSMVSVPDEIGDFFMTLKHASTRKKYPSPLKDHLFKIYIEVPVDDFQKFQSELTIINYENFLKSRRFDL